MLKKLPTRQNDGEARRQWMADDFFDLYVWYHPDGTIVGFQLCYDKMGNERALTWIRAGVFRHDRIDPGDSSPLDSRSPVIVEGCPLEAEPVRSEFIKRSLELEPQIRSLILEKLNAFHAQQST
ncbi:hypothetical protein BH23VER1_BH23VER1_21770 [soil metagenome]